MISSDISKRVMDGLKNLRAATETTYYAEYNADVTEAEIENREHPGQMLFDYQEQSLLQEREKESFLHAEDICYGTYKNQVDEYNWIKETFSEEEYEAWLVNNVCSDPCTPTTAAASMSAENAISPDNYKKFLQDIAQEAKEWMDRPSDRKKIAQAIEYVLDAAKSAPRVDNKLASRLKHDEMMRIVSKLVSHVNK